MVALVGATAVAMGAVASAADVGEQAFTSTESTLHVTTVVRVDLDPVPAPECDFPGSDAVVVDQTSVAKDPVTSAIITVGPAEIMIGEDETVPHTVLSGDVNTNTRVTYETVVTQYFQAAEPGPPCALVLGISFTG